MGNRIFDQYSLLHFAAGVVAYFFKIKFSIWIIINICFELIENTDSGVKIINKLDVIWPGGKKNPDTLINGVSDVFFAALGWYIAYLLDKYGNKKGWHHPLNN